jgi:hypothetical protein
LIDRLTRYDERGWRATFYVTGIEHSLTADTASAWEPTPWHATRRAAGGLSNARARTVIDPVHPTTAFRNRSSAPGEGNPAALHQLHALLAQSAALDEEITLTVRSDA